MITAMSLPFLAKKPIDLPPIVSVELIQITDKTNIPFAPKAKKTIEKIKEKEKKLVSEQAPPKKVKKIKPDSVPMPDDKVKKVEKIIPANIVIPTVSLLAAPGPKLIIRGNTPIIVDKLVISIGLNLIDAASNTATSKFFPSFLN